MLCLEAYALDALLDMHYILYDEDLLQDRVGEHLPLDGELHLKPPRVRLCPDKARVHQLHLIEAFQALDAKREKLTGLELGLNPGVRRVQVPVAKLAKVDCHRLWNAIGDVDLRAYAIHAHVARV
eukprot:Mycagemm_TRINITY_DN9978_c0_g1::TRINITY_DN9978_c0_g1_i2::g.3524::m.3524 type:complete len:125 gc:universal TRINITY_DN9978_c0_g1_i2:1194-1568(+)